MRFMSAIQTILLTTTRYSDMMKKIYITYFLLCLAVVFSACNDEEYSVSKSDLLFFSEDTIRMDTVFCNVPSSTKDFWIYNKTGKSIRVASIKQDRGNQSGFRVNVDGIYLGPTAGYQTNEVEVKKGDSIRVFVELTAVANGLDKPKEMEDNLYFTLESGAVQKINLNAFAWDAEIKTNPKIHTDTSWSGGKPIVIYGSLTVDSLATLTLEAGTTIYFRDEAKVEVYGRLRSLGEKGNEVTLRGYRLDNMFDYLPYDRVSGQWGGIHFHESSYNNEIHYTDLHSAYTGIEIDSCDVSKPTLFITESTVHNCQGYGIEAHKSWVEINNCQITNTLKDCFYTDGGKVKINNSTIAQFYPYDSNRGAALHFTTEKGDLGILCRNTLITGYADDVVNGNQTDSLKTFDFIFENCILRTPKVTTADSLRFTNVLFESHEDTITTGKKHFKNIDIKNLIYNFQLDSISPAIDKGNPLTASPIDRNGVRRDDKPDIGAFERKN